MLSIQIKTDMFHDGVNDPCCSFLKKKVQFNSKTVAVITDHNDLNRSSIIKL